ncbi:tail assembly protein [Cedecea neteri]|uniref:Tail assembly protein n=1 Tax=Cedecea neteri TaxID=158822 RepID=A0A089Q102_9ENTR|nr:tail fiber assembly protein [Cedecea neteri]AIR06347.1 tail assembly protein [Cedecea neteri]
MKNAELGKNQIATTPGTIIVYNYTSKTREYLSSSVEYLAVGLGLPAYSCIDAPPVLKDGVVVCRTEDFSAWEYVDDHRGDMVYSKKTGQPRIISMLGGYPLNMTLDAPITPYDKWDGEKWVTDIAAQKAGDISEAELKRQAFLSEANRVTADWRTELTLGIISSADKEMLTAWMEYTKAVKAINTSTAPDIEWPIAPDQ